MKLLLKSLSSPGFVAILLLALSCPSTTAAIERVITPGQSIAAEIQNAHASGDFKPQFSLYAERVGSEQPFMVHVREAEPAVTSMTTVSIQDGASSHVNETDVAAMLVSDEVGVVALIAVDKKGGKVNGIVQKDGASIKFTQKGGGGGKALAITATDFAPPAWSCGNTPAMERRFLFEDGHDDNHDHFHHDHSDHDHSDHNHNHNHDHDFNPSNTNEALADIQHSLRGSELRMGKRRRVQGGSYAFWVDVYIEIDYALCSRNGETCATGIGPKTINYVNALFTGANTIYETEINTHLNILHINLNRNYDSAINSGTALDTMVARYGRTSWHYTSPSGIKPDLHHALLGKDLGGGVAYVGVICNPGVGFGVSGGISGAFVSMGNAAIWDMTVFMHELGHNFGTGHTHDGEYSPRIDTCGISCPPQLPLAKSATIMSYCHGCSGGMANVAYTFGGKYKGFGSRGDANSYNNSPLVGTVSTEPRRVNAKMYNHVSSRGTCTQQPPSTPTPTPPAPTPPAPTPPAPTPPTTGTLGDWEQCSSNSQCRNGCCSGMYSNGVLKCTPLSGGFNPNVCMASAITVQAESYSNMFGVFRENTSDVGGGVNVGWIDTWDWMSYPAVTIPSAGVYKIEYRVARGFSGSGSLQLEKAGGTPVYGSISIPATGGWQNWVTVSHLVTLNAGLQNFGIKATGGGWNFNWFRITKA